MTSVDYVILNQTSSNASPLSRPLCDLSLDLQRTMLHLKGDHMTEDGKGVDYGRLRGSKPFEEYVNLVSQLCTCDPSQLEEGERKAFFINIYNALTVHGLVSGEKLPTSVLEVSNFWKRTAYNVGGNVLSLDDIEHGILRGNKPHPSASEPQFTSEDPRRVLALTSCDPRVHFALVCGAKSCPAIQVYSAKNIERGLDQAAKSFCEQEVEIVPDSRQVVISKIFLWYSGDFGTTHREVLEWISKYLSDPKQGQLRQLLSNQETIEIAHREYNWQLNKL